MIDLEIKQDETKLRKELQTDPTQVQATSSQGERALRSNRKRDYKSMLEGGEEYKRTIEDE